MRIYDILIMYNKTRKGKMKKILGISLCALFAVSAANANIASEGYVNEKVGSINLTGITTNANNISALTTRVNGHDTSIQANTTKINTLDTAIQGMSQTQTQGDYVTYVKQENGDVTAEGASFDTSVSDTSESNKAPTSKAVAAYVKGKVDGLGVTALTGRVDANETAINTLDGRVDAHDTSITNLTTSVNDHNTRITNNANAITTLQARTTDLKALAYKDTVATADIDANAVTSAQIANDAVTSAKIDDETITNADVATNAQIASSKIAFDPTQTAVFGSGITSNLVADINSNRTNINAMLTEANGYDTCKASTDGCTLVVKNRQFYWEAIKRAEGEGAE